MIKTCSPDLLLADLKIECEGAPDILLRRSLMRAVKEFSSTCMLEVWVDVPTYESVKHYPFEMFLPEGYGVRYVTAVKYNDCCIPCLDDDCSHGCASGYTLDDMKQIRLHGYCPQTDSNDPECKDTLAVKVVLVPNADSCEIPCDMLDRFDEELKDGALGILLGMKGRAWTDFRLSEYYDNRFQGGIASAKCLVADKILLFQRSLHV